MIVTSLNAALSDTDTILTTEHKNKERNKQRNKQTQALFSRNMTDVIQNKLRQWIKK